MTLQPVLRFLRYVVMEFGALIVFWIGLYGFGIKPAIAATVVFILADGFYRWRRRLPVTRIYLLTSTLAVCFGAIDLYAANPFMIKYEAVVTNIATGLFFVAGARGEKSLIQEVAEQRNRGDPFPDRADVRHFFRLLTLFWAAYFFVKAAVYLWLGMVLPLQEALALRTAIGGASLAVMVAGSTIFGRRLFFLCRWLGLLPEVEPTALAVASPPAAGTIS
jgi:intracellular septation protein A